MSAAERPVPPPRLPPVPRRRKPKREPFNQRPALASLGEAPDWHGYPSTTIPPIIPERELHAGDAATAYGCAKCVSLAGKRPRARIYLNHEGVAAANEAIRRHPYH